MTSDWYPIVDSGLCKDNCFVCLHFCPQKVFAKDGTKVKVTKPDACLKGCNSCEGLCPVHAISFISARTIDIDGIKVGIDGMDAAFSRHPGDFEGAYREICEHNYIPMEAAEKFKESLRKEFEK